MPSTTKEVKICAICNRKSPDCGSNPSPVKDHWIECDCCNSWLHGRCCGISAAEVRTLDSQAKSRKESSVLLSTRNSLSLRSTPQRKAAAKLSFSKVKEKPPSDSSGGSFFKCFKCCMKRLAKDHDGASSVILSLLEESVGAIALSSNADRSIDLTIKKNSTIVESPSCSTPKSTVSKSTNSSPLSTQPPLKSSVVEDSSSITPRSTTLINPQKQISSQSKAALSRGTPLSSSPRPSVTEAKADRNSAVKAALHSQLKAASSTSSRNLPVSVSTPLLKDISLLAGGSFCSSEEEIKSGAKPRTSSKESQEATAQQQVCNPITRSDDNNPSSSSSTPENLQDHPTQHPRETINIKTNRASERDKVFLVDNLPNPKKYINCREIFKEIDTISISISQSRKSTLIMRTN